MKNQLPFTKEDLETIIEKHPTPFHIYDETAIRKNARRLNAAFAWADFQEYFAVKATPTPRILQILKEEGFGADASSMAELVLAERCGILGEKIMFTSNNTPAYEFDKAIELGAIINLDDITHVPFLAEHCSFPELICFRYNPGPLRDGNAIIGKPEEAKYGLTREQLVDAYRMAKERGATRFGLHTMVISNELDATYFVETAKMLFTLVAELSAELGIRFEFVNLGGGIGVPMKPEEEEVNLETIGEGVREAYESHIAAKGLDPLAIFMECGRVITGPYGYLISRVIHEKNIYKNYIGVDASMANLMRPGMYGAYHHLSVAGKEDQPNDMQYDVAGSLCENNDKFTIDRPLPKIDIGDLVVIHDTGAHGHSMGFNYNGKLRSAELLLKEDGSVELIRRAETLDDLFATLDFS